MPQRFLLTSNGVAEPESSVPVLPIHALRRAVVEVCRGGARLVALFGRRLPAAGGVMNNDEQASSSVNNDDEKKTGPMRLYAVLADDYESRIALAAADLPADAESYPSLTQDLPEAHWFERELWEETGIEPEGHPWLKPIRREKGYDFFRVEGPEVHEVAVGPVHAGIIEPGHFRFQCAGEEVMHLEIQLGYQRRGAEACIERALGTGDDRLGKLPFDHPRRRARAALVAETIAGDSSIAHGTAHAQALEGLAGLEPPPRAQVLRAVALELERLANHVGDLGGLSTDIAFLPGSAYMPALRGEYLNLGQELCGNRYGRSFVRAGGVLFDLDAAALSAVLARVEKSKGTLARLSDLFFESPSVLARLERTGAVSLETAEEVGLVGVAARACGCDRDVRRDHATGAFRFGHIPVALAETGDVYARAVVRRHEAQRSVAYVSTALSRLPEGAVRKPCGPLAPGSIVVSLVEGWRGEVVHAAVTDARGAVARYKVVDPSFHNWFGLALALRGQEISDFPLCNKSFNLSYAGHDL